MTDEKLNQQLHENRKSRDHVYMAMGLLLGAGYFMLVTWLFFKVCWECSL